MGLRTGTSNLGVNNSFLALRRYAGAAVLAGMPLTANPDGLAATRLSPLHPLKGVGCKASTNSCNWHGKLSHHTMLGALISLAMAWLSATHLQRESFRWHGVWHAMSMGPSGLRVQSLPSTCPTLPCLFEGLISGQHCSESARSKWRHRAGCPPARAPRGCSAGPGRSSPPASGARGARCTTPSRWPSRSARCAPGRQSCAGLSESLRAMTAPVLVCCCKLMPRTIGRLCLTGVQHLKPGATCSRRCRYQQAHDAVHGGSSTWCGVDSQNDDLQWGSPRPSSAR